MANPLMGMVQGMMNKGGVPGAAGGGNPMFSMIMQMMANGGKMNPEAMVNQLLQSNPQAKQAWDQAQQMAQGKSQQEIQNMVQEMAGKNGLNSDQVNQIANKFGGK